MSETNGKRAHEGEEPDFKRPRLDLNGDAADVDASQAEYERAVGITAYVAPELPGFECIVKQRYTDFLVNEILPDGTVLHVQELPRKSAAKATSEQKNGSAETASVDPVSAQSEAEVVLDGGSSTVAGGATTSEPSPATAEFSLSAEDEEALTAIFGKAVTDKIVILHKAVLARPDKKPREQPNVESEVISEKSQRTQAHLAVRRVFDSRLETVTLQDKPGVIAIRAGPIKGATGARAQANGNSRGSQPKGRLGWDELGGEYLHFTLYKENKDTMEVLYFMASQFKLNIKNFQFAGTKDRRGVTVQRVSVFRIHADRLIGLNRLAKGWLACDFAYKKHGLELGELTGNEFLLTLRDVRFSQGNNQSDSTATDSADARDLVSTMSKTFRDRGFINYYGLQRFGTFSTGTHMIGKKMLKGDLEGAVDSLLEYDPAILEDPSADSKIPQENIARARAIKNWRETGETTKQVPRRFQAEASIMEYLSRKDRRTKQSASSRDWQGALMQIQRNLRLMYVHAYQSFIWNTVASERWTRFGDRVIAGDLVIVGEKDNVGKHSREEVDDDGEPVFHPADTDSAATADSRFVRARPLTPEEAESGVYDIFDIVLPLPGFDVKYPENEIGKYYEEFMASDEGGGLDPHAMRRTWKDISLSGDYRKLLARPGAGYEMQIQLCDDPLKQLVQTDVERLTKRQSGQDNNVQEVNGDQIVKTKDGSSRAAVMKFQLGSSQYATMALRELTKGGALHFRPDFSASK